MIQQAIAQVLGPLFESQFSDYSYGFRPGRNAQQAVRRVREYLRSGHKVVVDIDLAAFFDNVNHDVLMRLIAQRVADKRVLKLIGRYLHAGVMVDGVKQSTSLGVPQGGPLSPLLANIVLRIGPVLGKPRPSLRALRGRFRHLCSQHFGGAADESERHSVSREAFEADHQSRQKPGRVQPTIGISWIRIPRSEDCLER